MPNYVVNRLTAPPEVLQKLIVNEQVDFDLIMDYTENYGTKWNASETNIKSSTEVLFKTAWTPPHNVIEKLATITSEKIFHEWASEDQGYEVGKAIYENGRRIKFQDIGGTDEGCQLFEILFSLITLNS